MQREQEPAGRRGTIRTFSFGAEQGRPIYAFGSNFTMSRLVQTQGIHVGCMHISAGGSVGRHPGAGPQLFIVVLGDGWVEGADGSRVPIGAGEAAFWQSGEEHAAGSEAGMMAIIVEGDALEGELENIGPVSHVGGSDGG